MTATQRRRRLLYLRGSFNAITICTFLMLLGALADLATN